MVAVASGVLLSGMATGTATADSTEVARLDAFTRTQLNPPAPQEGNSFGFDVAIDGDTAVVGEWRGEGAAEDSGVAWVYVRQGGAWVVQAKLLATNGDTTDRYAQSVAISGDTIVVGAPYAIADAAQPENTGAAFVYVRSGDTWVEQAQLYTSEASGWVNYGVDVAVDGDTIVVGAPGLDNGSDRNAGVTFVYARSGTSWTQQARLVSNGGAYDNLGDTVAIDGDTVAAAATGDTSPGETKDGAVYVYVRTGSTWARQARLSQPDPGRETFLGRQLALDGDTIVAQTDPIAFTPYQTYVFVRTGATWSLQTTLATLDSQRLDGGLAVKGDVVLAGSMNGTPAGGCSSACGVTYVFVRTGSAWMQKKMLAAPQGKPGDRFGDAVDFDGVDAIVSARMRQAPGGGPREAGAAFVYDR